MTRETELAAALEPFAKKFHAHKNCRYGPPAGPHEDHDEIPVRFGDLRRAAAALTTQAPPEPAGVRCNKD